MDYKSQVYNLIQLLGEKHLDFYFVKNKEDVDSLIEETLNRFNLEDDYDFYYVSNYLIKKIIGDYDEHTEVLMKRKRLPMKVKMYDGKLYIIRGCDEIEPYKFKEITAINHININQIISEFEDKICYSKKEWFGVKLGVSLSSITDIKALPSINADEDIVFTIDGTDVNMTDIYNNAKALPNKPLEPMSYELLDDVIKIKYSLCMEKEEGQMQNMVDEIKQLSQKNSITKYIVDLRGNSGGNSEIIKPLIQFLEGKEIVTIVNNSVYSSGIWACNDLKKYWKHFYRQ